MRNKGFTLVELLAVIVVLAIVSGLAVISVNHIVEKAKKGVYQDFEATLKGAAQNYFIDHIDDIPKTERTLTMNDLSSYLNDFQDPNGGNCNYSFVKITRGTDISNNFNLNYQVCLICKLNDTETYASDMESDIKFCH